MRDDPEIFDAAKEYMFQAMEREAFPGFPRQKGSRELIRLSALFRLNYRITWRVYRILGGGSHDFPWT